MGQSTTRFGLHSFSQLHPCQLGACNTKLMLTVIAHKRTSDKIDSDACWDRADEATPYKMFVSRHKQNFCILWSSSGITPLRRLYVHMRVSKAFHGNDLIIQTLCLLCPLDDFAL